MIPAKRRIILVDPDVAGRERLACRLRAQDFVVDVPEDTASGAEMALSSPPAALIADLWMPGISGVQLCRLLRAEPATADVPVVLRGVSDDPRSRFWAERAGASAFVTKGRMGELARSLRSLTANTPTDSGFFMHLGSGSLEIRDRIAQHLDAALFESVIAAEVRALASLCSFERLFDAFSQLATRILAYRWIAISTTAPARLAIHSHPGAADATAAEVSLALGIDRIAPLVQISDEDASDAASTGVVVQEITFGDVHVGRLAVATVATNEDRGNAGLIALLARELAGAIRMTTLVEQAQRLATTDPLTGLLNRRAMIDQMTAEVARSERRDTSVAVLILDVDHFKSVNDRHGHGAGDAVLVRLGELLPAHTRIYDTVGRWGGEEFLAILPETDAEAAAAVAERLRSRLEESVVTYGNINISCTASIGVAVRRKGEPIEAFIERGDQAMYSAKTSGRNRVCVARSGADERAERAERTSMSVLRAIG